MTGELSRHDCKKCRLLYKELAQTNSNQYNHSCCCLIFLCVCFDTLRPSQKSAMSGRAILCWSCTEQRSTELRPATPRSQVKHSTIEPLRPFCCLKKMQWSFITPDNHTGLLVISFAACFFFFFFFLLLFTANYVDPASSGSSFEPCHKIAAIILLLA